MKQIKNGLLAIVTFLFIQTISAQTEDEIVNKHITALGGKEK